MNITEFLADYERLARYQGADELALYYLLEAHKDQLPELNEDFQKRFRQWSITGSAKIDMAIWVLLERARLFWTLLEEFQLGIRPDADLEVA